MENSERLVKQFDEKLTKALESEAGIWSSVCDEVKGAYTTLFGKVMGVLTVIVLLVFVAGVSTFANAKTDDTVIGQTIEQPTTIQEVDPPKA